MGWLFGSDTNEEKTVDSTGVISNVITTEAPIDIQSKELLWILIAILVVMLKNLLNF